MTTTRRQVHLAAHFPGVNNTTVWTDPLHRSQIDFSAFEHFGRTAERGRLDSIFFADSPVLFGEVGRRPAGKLEPTVLLTAIAGAIRLLTGGPDRGGTVGFSSTSARTACGEVAATLAAR